MLKVDTTNEFGKLTFKILLKALIVGAILFAVLTLATLFKYLYVVKVQVGTMYFLGVVFSYLLLVMTLEIYCLFSRKRLMQNTKTYCAIHFCLALAFVTNIYLASINIYLMPVALSAFLIAPIADDQDAFVSNFFTNIIMFVSFAPEYFSENSMILIPIITLVLTGVVMGSCASYIVSSDTKRLSYIAKGLAIGVVTIGLVWVMSVINPEVKALFRSGIAYLGIAVISQLVLGLLLQPIIEKIFNLVTNTRLVELTDHNSKLIKALFEEAPGTFNHSLAVANFAESCASAIGENPYLARACAYYHDIGKIRNSIYFKENQSDYNPHDEILPEVSADIIRSHTTEGKALCDKYKIPVEVSHVTTQHHGTMPIAVFYNKAQTLTDSAVDIKDYSYKGETPVSKIAAIIMLCDSSEAAIRAMDKPDAERVDKLLRKLISERIEARQFENCEITLAELDTIRRTIINAYGGQFHKRLKYPDGR